MTAEHTRQLEQLAARMSRDSRWQVTEAAFKLGLKLGAARAETQPHLSVEDELCAAAMDAASVTMIHGVPETKFDMKRMRAGIRRAFERTSGSCLVCGHDKPFAVRANGVGVCVDCRAARAETPTTLLDVHELRDGWQRAKDEDYPHIALYASRHFEEVLTEVERLRAALASLDAERPTPDHQLDMDVIKRAYGWRLSVDGEIWGLIAGDQGYEPTGIFLDDFKHWMPVSVLDALVTTWRTEGHPVGDMRFWRSKCADDLETVLRSLRGSAGTDSKEVK